MKLGKTGHHLCRTAVGALAAAAMSIAISGVAKADDWGKIDWKQFSGTQLHVLATQMPVAGVYKGVIDQFEKQTGIKVDFELLNDTDRKNRQLVDFSSHTGEYDVSNIGFSNREEFVAGNYLEDLTPYLKNDKLTDAAWYNFGDYPKDIIASGYGSNGKLVFVPFTAEYFLLWYRKDIFEAAGVKAPHSIADLEATAAKLKEARDKGAFEAFVYKDRTQPGAGEAGWNLFCTANRFGFDWVNFDEHKSNLLDPMAKTVMEFYTSMDKKYAPPGSGNWTWGDIGQAFAQGRLAMSVAGNASYATLEDPAKSKVAGKVGYAPPPMMENGRDPLWVWGWGMNADSKNKDAAWLFIEYMTSPNLIRQIAPQYGVPARLSVYDDPAYLKAMPSKEFVEAQQYMLTQGVNPHPQLISADYAQAADILSREMSNVVAGNKTVDEALADANKALLALGYKN